MQEVIEALEAADFTVHVNRETATYVDLEVLADEDEERKVLRIIQDLGYDTFDVGFEEPAYLYVKIQR